MRKEVFSCLIFLLGVMIFFPHLRAENRSVFDEDFLNFFRYRALGPARQGARILDIEVPAGQPYTFYVATASSGLWKTKNNGTTFQPIFDNQATIAIGDIAVAPSNPDIIWVGTGTPASGRLTLRGDGVYKSTDAGKIWKYMGLRKTSHIGRIAIHPRDPDIVYVAALGFNFPFNTQRGVHKTTDARASWNNVL
jgi:hypothetical protein